MAQYSKQVLLDSDSMSPESYLLHPSAEDVMARQRESFYDTALCLAEEMTINRFTSKKLNLKTLSAFLDPTNSCQRRNYTKSWAKLPGCWA